MLLDGTVKHMDKDNQSTQGQGAPVDSMLETLEKRYMSNQSTSAPQTCECPSSETMLQNLEQEREYALARVERITKAIRYLKDNPQAEEAYKIIVSGLHGGY